MVRPQLPTAVNWLEKERFCSRLRCLVPSALRVVMMPIFPNPNVDGWVNLIVFAHVTQIFNWSHQRLVNIPIKVFQSSVILVAK